MKIKGSLLNRAILHQLQPVNFIGYAIVRVLMNQLISVDKVTNSGGETKTT